VSIRITLIGCLLVPLAATIHGQILFSGSYVQDFDGLGPDGTSWPSGWSGVRYAGSGATGAPLDLGITAGGTGTGGLYNVGLGQDPDRALGSLASGSTVPRFGAQFQNVAGLAFDGLTLSGVMEQWRSGSLPDITEILSFEYSFNASHIDDALAEWFPLSDFDLTEHLTATTSATAVNGNLPDNQAPLQATLGGISWDPDTVLTIRWSDVNDTGSDGMYALDNFRLDAVQTVPEPSVSLLLGLTALGALSRRLRPNQLK